MRTRTRTGVGRYSSRGWVAVLWVCVACGCGQPRLSDEGYQAATALHSALIQRDAATLVRARTYLQTARDEGRITDEECDLLIGHIDAADGEAWEQSADDLRDLLAAQNTEL